MADQLQIRRGTTAQNNVFTGAQGEMTMDTDLKTIRIHDNFTPGGFAMATRTQVSNGTFYFNDNTGGGSAANAYILAAKSNTNLPTSYQDGIQLGFVTTNANTGPSSANFTGLGVKPIKYPGGVDPAAGDVFGRVYLIYDAGNDWLELQRKASAPPPQLRAIGASVGGNALIVSMPASIISFRSPVLSNGAVNDRTVTSSLSITAPVGATLGTTSGAASRIVVLAVDNAGTVSLALVNQNTTQSLDETTLINTTAISAGSTSANTIYGVANASGLPFRVLGYIDSTQPTAGTWTSSPSQVQPIGGQIILNLAKIVMASAQNTTSGTSIDFTGIPSFVNRVTLSLNGVSTNGASPLVARLGTSLGVDATGWLCTAGDISGASTGTTSDTTGHRITSASSAATLVSGSVVFTRVSGNTWAGSSVVDRTASISMAGSSKALAGVLDRIRLSTISGTDVFDAGSVNIIYEG